MIDLFDTVSEYKNGTRFDKQMIGHVSIVASQDENRLFVWHTFGHVAREEVAIDLSQLESAQTEWPVLLVRVVHELIDYALRTCAFNERTPHDRFQDRIGCRDYASPACYFRHWQTHAPSLNRKILISLIRFLN